MKYGKNAFVEMKKISGKHGPVPYVEQYYLNLKINNMQKLLIVLTASLFLISCKKEAKSVEKTEAFELEFLFEKDGCKVYRFWDGRYIYWASCAGSIEYEQHTQSGKSHSTHQVQEFTTK